MTERLADKVIVVTGGSSGIGHAIAVRLAAEGAAVVIGARGAEAGERAVSGIRDAGGEALFVATDVTVPSGSAALVHAAATRYGRLDGAVNNAGGGVATAPVPDITDADWRAALDQNLTSVFYGLRHQIPAIEAAGGGSIVNNASVAGVIGIAGLASYVAAKHGVVDLTRSPSPPKQGERRTGCWTGSSPRPARLTCRGPTSVPAWACRSRPPGNASPPACSRSCCRAPRSPAPGFGPVWTALSRWRRPTGPPRSAPTTCSRACSPRASPPQPWNALGSPRTRSATRRTGCSARPGRRATTCRRCLPRPPVRWTLPPKAPSSPAPIRRPRRYEPNTC